MLSDPLPDDAWPGRTGFVHAAVMADFPDLSGYQVYACGAPAMIDAARRDFTTRCGLPPRTSSSPTASRTPRRRKPASPSGQRSTAEKFASSRQPFGSVAAKRPSIPSDVALISYIVAVVEKTSPPVHLYDAPAMRYVMPVLLERAGHRAGRGRVGVGERERRDAARLRDREVVAVGVRAVVGMDDPRSAPRREYRDILFKWAKVMQGRLVIYDYDQNMLVWRDIPDPSQQAFRRDIKQYQKAGILGHRYRKQGGHGDDFPESIFPRATSMESGRRCGCDAARSSIRSFTARRRGR